MYVCIWDMNWIFIVLAIRKYFSFNMLHKLLDTPAPQKKEVSLEEITKEQI